MKIKEVRPKRVCSPRYAVIKAKKGIELNRWELEELAKDGEKAVEYAKLKGCRFPEAEKAILKELTSSGFYYRSDLIQYFIENEVVNKKFEKYLLKHGVEGHITDYAIRCLKRRWPEAEKSCFQKSKLGWAESETWVEYHKKLVGVRWPALEKNCRHNKDWSDFFAYLGNLDKHIAMRVLGRSNSATLLLNYAKDVRKGKLPPNLHAKMTMMSFDPKKQKAARRYFKFVKAREMRVVGWLAQIDEDERQALLEAARKIA